MKRVNDFMKKLADDMVGFKTHTVLVGPIVKARGMNVLTVAHNLEVGKEWHGADDDEKYRMFLVKTHDEGDAMREEVVKRLNRVFKIVYDIKDQNTLFRKIDTLWPAETS